MRKVVLFLNFYFCLIFNWFCFDFYISCLGIGLLYIVIINFVNVGFVLLFDLGILVLKKFFYLYLFYLDFIIYF